MSCSIIPNMVVIAVVFKLAYNITIVYMYEYQLNFSSFMKILQ